MMYKKIHDVSGKKKRLMTGLLIWVVAFLIGVSLGSLRAHAQMANEPWGFKQQNRASIAALMQQVEKSGDTGNATVSSSGYGGYDQLVCGGDGASSAAGNSTCIILNNSDGAIQIGQDAQGDQDATNTETTTVNGLSDVLNEMDGVSE